MVNLKELEKIVDIATNESRRIVHNDKYERVPCDIIELTDDMIDIIDYLREK